MADDTPLLPDEQDVKHLTDYLSFQKQLTDAYKTDLDIMDKMGKIDRNLETSLKQKIESARHYLNLQNEEAKTLQIVLQQQFTSNSANKAAMDHEIRSIKEKMKAHSDMASSLQQQVNFETAAAEHRYTEEHKYQDLVGSMFTKLTGFQNKHYKTYKDIYEQINKSTYGMTKYAVVIAGVLVVLTHIFEKFKEFDKSAADFRMEMGMTRDNAKGLRVEAERIAINFQGVGVTIQGAYEAFSALGREAGSVFAITSDMVKTTSLLKSQLGVSEENSAGFLKNMAAVSKSTMQAQQDMAYIAADMAQAAGVPLNQIMADVGKASGNTLTMMSRVPNQIMRSAIELRRMGTSLKEAANSSREILNFSDNINAEMEASVLLGRSINLQRARELAYRRDLEGSAKEILRITKSVNFENMDVFQQEAFARATGKSVDELLRMVQAERQWDKARRDPNLSSKVTAYEKLHQSVEAEAKARGKNLELMIEQRANQDRLTSISNRWNQIMTKVGAAFLPIIDFTLGIVEGLTPLLPILMTATKLFVGLGSEVTRVMMVAGRYGVETLSVVEKIFLWVGKFTAPIARVFGMFGRFGSLIGGIGKAIPGLGEVIIVLQSIWEGGKLIFEIFDDIKKGNIGTAILKGLFAPMIIAYRVLVKPFVDAYNWIMGLMGGHSPSKLGMSILKGIVSIGPMLFDALTAPFRHGLAWIMDKIPGLGKFSDKLRGGLGGMLNKPLESRATAAYVPAATITPDGVSVSGKPNDKPIVATTEKAKDDNNDKTLQDILGAINMLNSNLSSGKIGIYLDGQLVSATLARQTEFRGGYGVNKV